MPFYVSIMAKKGELMFSVPFGKDKLSFQLPSGWKGDVADPPAQEPILNLEEEVTEALRHPMGCPSLRELARPGQRVCLVVTDATRPCPDDRLLPPILSELEQAGVREDDITVLIALGMHRPTTPAEREAILGPHVVRRLKVLDHDPINPEGLVALGATRNRVPIVTNRIVLETDLLIATGIVEPHQYAGYSGGAKTVAIGAAGEATIEHTHGPAFVEHPGTRLGNLDGNPFQEAVQEIGKRVRLRFIVNVVADGDENVVAVRAGDPGAAFLSLIEMARSLYTVPIPHSYDVAIAGVGHPKDSNLYQASRAASYLVFAPRPVVREGGFIILPAPCPEGPGQGLGEQRFYRTLKEARDIPTLVQYLRTHGYKPGEQRAFVMAKVLEHCRVIVVGSECPEVVREVHMLPAQDLEEAFRLVEAALGHSLQALVVPHALLTLPVIS